MLLPDGKKIVSVDFDGTLHTMQSNGKVVPWPEIGEPIFDVINAAKAEKADGSIIILNTCREGRALVAAIEWCKQFGLEFDYINNNAKEAIAIYGDCRKIMADEYWDDYAVNTANGAWIDDNRFACINNNRVCSVCGKTTTNVVSHRDENHICYTEYRFCPYCGSRLVLQQDTPAEKIFF